MRLIAPILAVSLLALSACDKSPTPGSTADASSAQSDETLAGALAGADNLSVVATAMKDTGISSVFDGTASYTVIAPTDDAFVKLGDIGKSLQTPEDRAVMVAVMRNHIVPGFLTPKDIDAALTSAKGPIKMTTMGDSTLTFAKSGSDIVVTSGDGTKGTLGKDTISASNGAVIPVDTVLKKF